MKAVPLLINNLSADVVVIHDTKSFRGSFSQLASRERCCMSYPQAQHYRCPIMHKINAPLDGALYSILTANTTIIITLRVSSFTNPLAPWTPAMLTEPFLLNVECNQYLAILLVKGTKATARLTEPQHC